MKSLLSDELRAKKGCLSLPSTASVAVLCLVGSIIITIFLGGINTLFASSSSKMPGMMHQHMGMQNTTNQMPGMMVIISVEASPFFEFIRASSCILTALPLAGHRSREP